MLALPLPLETLLAAGAILMLGYAVFGLTGFGAGIVALPLLAQWMPIRFAVPILIVIDLSASALVGLRGRGHVDRAEMRRLLPMAAAGMLVGGTLLLRAPERMLLATLGVFTLTLTAWTLLNRVPQTKASAAWAWPAGAVGGVFTALFGTGGPVYTAYLARRIHDKDRLRATTSATIFFTAIGRALLLLVTGLFLQPGMLWTALLLLPPALAGLALGSRLHARLPAARVLQAVWALLAASGMGLIVRVLAGG